MSKPDYYREQIKVEFNTLFNTLGLKENQKQYLRGRWMDQVLWMEGRASKARDWHYRLRLTTIIGGVIIPILVSLNLPESQRNLSNVIRYITIGLGGVVAVSTAVEEFFNYGERWRHYRRSVESLKAQGWQFSQLTGSYSTFTTHVDAFPAFTAQVEDILQRDVEVYATQVAKEKVGKEEGQLDPSLAYALQAAPNNSYSPQPSTSYTPAPGAPLNPAGYDTSTSVDVSSSNVYSNDPAFTPGSAYTNDPAFVTGSAYTNDPAFATGSAYTNDPAFATGSAYTNDPAFATGSAYTNDPAFATGSAYTNDPAFATGSAYTNDPAFATGSAYTNDPAFATGSAYTNDPADVIDPAYTNDPGYSTNQDAPADIPSSESDPGHTN